MKESIGNFYIKSATNKIISIILGFSLFIILAVLLLNIIGIKAYPKYSFQEATSTSFGFDQGSHVAGYGVNASRIDSQITLAIPEDKADDVYEYLRVTYIDNYDLMKTKFPNLDIRGQDKIDISEFTDEYYDTPNLDLDKSFNSARYRSRINTTNENDPKSGRELVQVKATPPGQFDFRTELKFSVENNVISQKNMTKDDTVPLLKLVNNNERTDFKKALQTIGVNPYGLRKIFTINQKRSRVYIDLNGKNFLSFSVDEGGARKFIASGKFSSLDLGLVEDVYTPASASERDVMWAIRDFMVLDLLDKFPDLKQTTQSKYSIVLNQLRNKIPYFDLGIKFNLI